MQYQFDGERERRAEFAMPKRTKQMGGIEQRLRIFVEDYVYTYLYQYGRSGGGAEKLAALVGKYYELEGQRVLLISGAIQAKGTLLRGSNVFVRSFLPTLRCWIWPAAPAETLSSWLLSATK